MVTIKTEEEIAKMKYAGKVCFDLLESFEHIVKTGVTTKELNDYAYEFIVSHKCTPSFLNYEGYPASICTSINEEVVHGIPGKRKLKYGDIISLDVGACFEGYHADTARTYKVGNVSKEVEKLMKETKRALYEGLSVVKPGIKLNDVCTAVERVAKESNFGVVRELTGHGIGTTVHEDPFIPNYSNKDSELILEVGMVLAIEPMFTLHGRKIWVLEDDWTIVTQDSSPAAHYEHTIAVTKDGYEILTGE